MNDSCLKVKRGITSKEVYFVYNSYVLKSFKIIAIDVITKQLYYFFKYLKD